MPFERHQAALSKPALPEEWQEIAAKANGFKAMSQKADGGEVERGTDPSTRNASDRLKAYGVDIDVMAEAHYGAPERTPANHLRRGPCSATPGIGMGSCGGSAVRLVGGEIGRRRDG